MTTEIPVTSLQSNCQRLNLVFNPDWYLFSEPVLVSYFLSLSSCLLLTWFCLRLSASQQTQWSVFSTPLPPVLHCLPHNCTADALASTGALYRKDHLGIFRFGNLRKLGCDWLLWPHDNLGRKCSCVLSPSVSLEGSWGVFGGLGRPLSFNITGKQRNGEKLYLKSLHPCMAFYLLDVPSFTAIWICEDSWLRNKQSESSFSNQVG